MKGSDGFTLVEVLVAMLILTIGIIALIGSSALVTRMITQGQIFSEASALAAQRIETLRSGGCAGMGSGTAVDGPYALSWTVVPIADGKVQRVELTVTMPTRRGTTDRVFATAVLC